MTTNNYDRLKRFIDFYRNAPFHFVKEALGISQNLKVLELASKLTNYSLNNLEERDYRNFGTFVEISWHRLENQSILQIDQEFRGLKLRYNVTPEVRSLKEKREAIIHGTVTDWLNEFRATGESCNGILRLVETPECN